MRTNCNASLFVAIFLCLTATLAFAQHSAKGKAAEDATTALLQMHSSYQRASATQKQQLLTQFTAMAAQREQLLLSLMQSNPGDVLRVAIPNNVSHTMPPTVKQHVEQSVHKFNSAVNASFQGMAEAATELRGASEAVSSTALETNLQATAMSAPGW